MQQNTRVAGQAYLASGLLLGPHLFLPSAKLRALRPKNQRKVDEHGFTIITELKKEDYIMNNTREMQYVYHDSEILNRQKPLRVTNLAKRRIESAIDNKTLQFKRMHNKLTGYKRQQLIQSYTISVSIGMRAHAEQGAAPNRHAEREKSAGTFRTQKKAPLDALASETSETW